MPQRHMIFYVQKSPDNSQNQFLVIIGFDITEFYNTGLINLVSLQFVQDVNLTGFIDGYMECF